MSRSARRPKPRTPGDGCWYCMGRPRHVARSTANWAGIAEFLGYGPDQIEEVMALKLPPFDPYGEES